MKIANLLFAVLFALAAIVQYNDPDPWSWIAVYAAAAILCGLAIPNRAPRAAFAVLGVICVGWMLGLVGAVVTLLGQGNLTLLADSMSPERPYIEESREFLGLGLILASCVLNFVAGARPEPDSG